MDLITDFLFAEAQVGKPVEFLMVGVFPDQMGRMVEIGDKDLDNYAANFEAGAAGQEVPIDVDHRREESAGWLKRVWRVGNKLLADVDWNSLGQQLVGDKIYLYLSATLDTAGKIIKSVSLTNFPAIKGLMPVELSEGLYGIGPMPDLMERIKMSFEEVIMKLFGLKHKELADGVAGSVRMGEFLQAKIHRAFTNVADDWAASGLLSVDERKQLSSAIGEALETFAANVGPIGERLIQVPGPDIYLYSQSEIQSKGGHDMNDEERAALEEEIRNKILAEMAEKEQTVAELREQVQAEVEAEMAEKFKKRAELREFAEEVTSGDYGLATKPEEIVELLEAIEDDEQLKRVQEMLKAKVVDFSERGSSREGQGGKEKLPSAYAVLVRTWQEEGHDLAEFFEVNKDELGDMDQYDLSEFEKQE